MATLSQQDVRSQFGTHTSSLDLDYTGPKTVGRMTEDEATRRRALFEANKAKYLENLNAAKAQLIKELPRGLNVYYFIGRLNPPHPGHIETLTHLINTARKKHTEDGLPFQVIILLGSGPKKIQTLNDPLDFELKKRVVIDLLQTKIRDITTLLENGSVAIEEMDKAAVQISDTIKKIIEINETIIDIETFRFSGDKDEDVEKLKWIEKSIENSLNNLNVVTNVVGVTALETENVGTAFSATEVRNDALSAYIEEGLDLDLRFEIFQRKYDRTYDRNTHAIYTAIITQAKNLTTEEIQNYINYKILPGSRLKKTKGGSRRKTKRRKTKHRKTKTRRTKRRRSRRRN
jgi:hypothetical protein